MTRKVISVAFWLFYCTPNHSRNDFTLKRELPPTAAPVEQNNGAYPWLPHLRREANLFFSELFNFIVYSFLTIFLFLLPYFIVWPSLAFYQLVIYHHFRLQLKSSSDSYEYDIFI